MTAFRVALYDSEGALVKTYVGEPLWLKPTAQQTADMVARSADAGCNPLYRNGGVVAVWADPDLVPAQRAGDSPRPDAVRAFGGGRPSVPAYRWDHSGEWDVLLTPGGPVGCAAVNETRSS